MSKQNDKNELQEVILWFKEQFPKAFSSKVAKIKPLQLGIMDEILDLYERLDYPPFSKKKIRAGLNFYTASPAYLKAQLVGKMRVDLYGYDVEEVNQSQADYAAERNQQYKELRKKKAEKLGSKLESEDNK